MPGERSLLGRVAWAAALAAFAAALISAIATSVLAAFLLQRAEDRRLHDAVMVLALELEEGPAADERVQAIALDEAHETQHSGITFAILDSANRHIAGDDRVGASPSDECETRGVLRVCRAQTSNGLTAIAASRQSLPTSLFAVAAITAALFAGAATWIACRPISRAAIAPLARLRSQLSTVDVEGGAAPDLGPLELVLEVDQMRETVEQLLARVQQSIDQARRFAANAAHEMRTPLTALSAELELLREETSSSETSDSLSRIERKVSELRTLVERLLILATPKAASTERNEIVSLRDLVEDAAAALAPKAGSSVHPLGVEADALVRGDSVLLGMMVTNALSNAYKFGDAVDVAIHTGEGQAILLFDDLGPGIEATERERVFEAFFRSKDAIQRRIPGHGLGLALIRHIAESHSGSASFHDKPSGGARLEIRLPLALDTGE